MSLALADSITTSAAHRTDRRRVLLVSYHFPPVGGAGVQRPVKFVKYLRKHGWEASVLTAANPSAPVFDHSLCHDVPESALLIKARTWEPGYRLKQSISATGAATSGRPSLLRRWLRGLAGAVLQPDPQVLWHPAAYWAGRKLLRELPHDVVLATAPPYSNLLLGRRLADAFHLPLVLDFRDEWDLSSEYLENSSRGERPHRVQSRMQSRLLRRADIVIATTEASARRLTERLRSAGGRGEVRCIHNGFDEDDFAALPWLQHAASLSKRGPGDGTTGRRSTVYWPPHPKPLPRGNGRAAASEAAAPPAESDRETFRIVYAGTLWNLTSVEPLARGVERLSESQRDLPGRLEVTFVGRKTPPQRALVERIAAAGCRVVSEDYCDHDRAVWLMSSADALCLLLSDLPGAERVVPAKLFEYLALGREILAILPDGEAAEIVGRFFPESRFRPDDPAGIADWLRTRITGERLEVAEIDSETLAPFTRQHQAGQLAEILESLIVSEDD